MATVVAEDVVAVEALGVRGVMTDGPGALSPGRAFFKVMKLKRQRV